MKLEMTLTKNTVVASTGMHPYAFLKAVKLAETLNGQVCTTDLQARFKATFKSAKIAKQFVTEWNAQYEQALADKAEAKAKPQAKRTRKAKGDNKGIDFGKVTGKTKSERNKGAHALILATGVKSGSDEYKALWEEWTKVR